jgi:hypothetical protein
MLPKFKDFSFKQEKFPLKYLPVDTLVINSREALCKFCFALKEK